MRVSLFVDERGGVYVVMEEMIGENHQKVNKDDNEDENEKKRRGLSGFAVPR